MNDPAYNENSLILRKAKTLDIPILVDHHHKMFVEIYSLQKIPFDSENLKIMDKAYTEKLQNQINSSICIACVAVIKNQIVASGIVTISSVVPIPEDPQNDIAYIHGIFTEKEYRRKGLAKKIIKMLVNYCAQRGLKRISLVTSDAGKPLYKKLGFVPVDNILGYWIERVTA